jgi:hypothetical protein
MEDNLMEDKMIPLASRRSSERSVSSAFGIEVSRVKAVMMADGWHQVEESSFDVADYAYVGTTSARYCGGNGKGEIRFDGRTSAVVCTYAGTWREAGAITMFCPITAIQAVRY